ncbi:triose-phosphate isomerase [Leucobacter sp. GX24907]
MAATATEAGESPLAQLPPGERTPLIAGNWKMNFDHLQAIAFVQKLSWSLKDARHDYDDVEVAVFPPFTDLRSVQTLLAADRLELALGAQDVSQHESGAHTGDVSAAFLTKLDVKYAIVGHSERRADHAEDDDLVGAKAAAAIRAGLVPVVCVGETAADLEEHGAAAIPVAQLDAVLATLSADAEFVVAYEPVWAIGSGQAATPEQAEEVCRALREQLHRRLGPESAISTRVLYGGSVSSQNIAALMRQPNIDGALVGGASLKAEEFSRIVRFRSHVTGA